jgi:hypothetical protein
MSASFLKTAQAALQDLALAQIVSLAFLITLITAFMIAREVFKPIDKCYRLGGRSWKLPSGPRGWPIFGNMWEIQRGGSAIVKFIFQESNFTICF